MLDALCKLLGIREDQAEDALRSERAAREALTRRSFFGVAGALAAGTAFSFAAPVDDFPYLFTAGPSTYTSFNELLKRHYSVDTAGALLSGGWGPGLMRVLAVDQSRGTITVG